MVDTDKNRAIRQIQSLQLQQMFSGSYVSLATSILLALILAYTQREVIAFAAILAWLSVVVLLTLSRLALVLHHQRAKVEVHKHHSLLMNFRIGVVVSGLVWGSASFMMFPADNPEHQMFLIFMLAGLTAGGVATYAADFVSVVGFCVAALVPLAVRLFAVGGGLSTAMGVAITLYLGFMILSGRKSNQHIRDNIVLRLEATRREEAIKSSEEQFRLLVRHSPVGIFHYDTNLIITYCNERLAEILKSTVDRVVGLDMKTLHDKSVLPSLVKALTGQPEVFEGHYFATVSDANGWIAMTCAPARDIDDKVVGGIAIVQDITERKKSEKALQESEQRLRSIIETEPECIKVVDSRGRLLEMNAAGLAMLEADSLQEAQEQSLMGYIDREYQAVFMSLHQQVMLGESGILQFKITGLKGTSRWLETHATPMLDADGKITSLLGITRDITERKRSEQTEKRLTRAFRLLSRCGAAMARTENESELLTEICQLAVETGGYLMAWVGFADDDATKTVKPVAQSGHEEGYLKSIDITW